MISFDPASLRRVADVTRQVERDGRGRQAPRRLPLAILPIKVMLVTQQVGAATASGPGKGKGRYYEVHYAADDSASYGTPYGDEVPLYTIDTANPTPAGKQVVVGSLDGRPVILVELCP